ncbi:ATP-dependent helicase HrpB [Aestuariispira ectoiniformans]|uniref:ATP-dependent helicase HrpB n=1 Tax=Aestuariispira ectoiniformans TaxID=2775080 RepID=UPI00223B4D20|nr:ATP-dependent helicase HrpB [Aestuariispira ectoiniformans]
MNRLPIDEILPDLCTTLAAAPNAVLQAPPGAGKTTKVPLALLDQDWLQGRKIVMLEPRRLATRAAAHRMAQLLGEKTGETVGYRMQLDSKVGPNTKIEVVTEGILTRRLQRDPELADVACVIFDEFHERSLQADLGLALTLDCQAGLRDDLRILVMSATLDADPVAKLLDDAPLLTSEGRAFPVETRYLPQPDRTRIDDSMVQAVRQALNEESGSILAFLPGEGEIRRVADRLESGNLPGNVTVAPLYGALPQTEQDKAIAPTPEGQRKVVLATSIAETSLTIDGIRVVIDSGQARVPRFDPNSGLTRLETVPVSMAAADQRRGRAGRLEPGVCYRLWNKAAEGGMPRFARPEIEEADLTPLTLDLANWGVIDVTSLSWMTTPPPAGISQAQGLLRDLGTLDKDNRITAHGKQLARLPMHPRLAHMVVTGAEHGLGKLAVEVAALLSERDILQRRGPEALPVDMRLRVRALHGERIAENTHRGSLSRAKALAKQWARSLKHAPQGKLDIIEEDEIGLLLAFAYPDRIGQRRPGKDARYRMAGGKGAVLDNDDPLAGEAFLALAEMAGKTREGRVRLAAPLSKATLETIFADRLVSGEMAAWDSRQKQVAARRQTRLGALVLSDAPAKDVSPDQISAALLDGIRETGPHCLTWSKEALALRGRVACLRHAEGEDSTWPDWSDDALLDTMEDWLLPYLSGKSRLDQMAELNLKEILLAGLDWNDQQRLDQLAPTHWTVSSGSNIRIDYSTPEAPVLPVKLQEMFGATETPAIANGRVALVLHLLSPAGRPLQVTQDLPAFWAGSYTHVKAEMKGRYPKHPWPDDPMAAAPTRHTKKRSEK